VTFAEVKYGCSSKPLDFDSSNVSKYKSKLCPIGHYLSIRFYFVK